MDANAFLCEGGILRRERPFACNIGLEWIGYIIYYYIILYYCNNYIHIFRLYIYL